MPFGGLLSLGTAAISGGSALAGLFGGSPASNVPAPNIQSYNYGSMQGADTNAFGGTNNLAGYNIPANLLPQYSSIAQSMANNPYAPLFQQGAGVAGGMGIQSGVNNFNAGGALQGGSLSALPDVSALLSLGFDPQNALYARTQQQVTDQTRAGLEARGIDNTPYGAGVEGQTLSNFNIDWQNNLLNRAGTAAQSAGGLLNNIGSGANTGANLQAGAPGQVLAGYGQPYNTFQGINTNALQALSGLGQFGQSAAQIPQQQIADYLQYLSQGNQANATANQGNLGLANFQLNQANSGFGQNQILGANLGSALSGIAKNPIFGGGGSAGLGSALGNSGSGLSALGFM